MGEFPSNPVIRIPCSHCRRPKFNSWSGAKIPQAMQCGKKYIFFFNFFNLKNKNSHGFRVRSERQINESEGKEEEGEQRRNSEKLRFQRSRVQMWWPDPFHSHEYGYLSREPSHCITPRTADHTEFSEAVQWPWWLKKTYREGHWRWRDPGKVRQGHWMGGIHESWRCPGRWWNSGEKGRLRYRKGMTLTPSKPDLKYSSTNCSLYALAVNLWTPQDFWCLTFKM